MTSSTTPPSDFNKLTVPQLKAICKERRITGYSKLTKAGLLQKLAESVHASTPALHNNQATNSSTIVPSGLHVQEVRNPAGPVETTQVDIPSGTNTTTPLASELLGPWQNRSVTNTTSTQSTSNEKRPAYTDISAPPKRIRTSLTSATNLNVGHDTAVPETLPPLQKPSQAADPSVFKVPEVPPQRKGSLHGGALWLGQDAPLATGRTTTTDSARPRLVPEVPASSQNPTQVSSATSTVIRKTSSARRAAHTATPAMGIRTSLTPTTKATHESPTLKTSTLQQTMPVGSSVFKVHEAHTPLKSVASAKKLPTRTNNVSVATPQIASQGRFKRLVPLKPKPIRPNQADSEPLWTPSNIHAKPLPTLSHISLPPKASERKWVYRWAAILSALCPTDRPACVLVSRTFRYAVYLSAEYLLSKNYAGRRLDAVFEEHPRNTTNFWPYLRLRTSEVSERRLAFKLSFLGRYMCSVGYDPLSERLWASPDNEKQVSVALRFVLTRMWFAVSVGAYGHDASRWSQSVIRDVREVVKGEIWQVISQCRHTGECGSFYVLEATCEVIGRPPTSQAEHTLGNCLRVDWSTWISQQSQASLDLEPRSLLGYVKWSNVEDYHLGISKAWLCRVQGQDANNVAKRSVAQKYILASVVANGISGQWMSTNAMAQEFASLTSKNPPGSRAVGRSVNAVNMYLPAHHHIESVHFTTAKGEVLHAAVAVVQTPGREYYVLRDNGMQVGCEEEGIPDVWQQILGCDELGRACQACL